MLLALSPQVTIGLRSYAEGKRKANWKGHGHVQWKTKLNSRDSQIIEEQDRKVQTT